MITCRTQRRLSSDGTYHHLRQLGAMVGAVAATYGGGAAGYQAAFAGLIMLAVLILLTALTLKSKTDEQIDTD